MTRMWVARILTALAFAGVGVGAWSGRWWLIVVGVAAGTVVLVMGLCFAAAERDYSAEHARADYARRMRRD